MPHSRGLTLVGFFMRVVVVFMLFLLHVPAYAASECSKPANSDALQEKATQLVQHLPEVVAWAPAGWPKLHPRSVYFGSGQQISLGGECYFTVYAYTNHPDHFDLWHVFAVNFPTSRILIQHVPTGEFVPLKE